MLQSDILIAGAGLIGLSLSLELAARGAQVTVLDSRIALAQSSSAAAGMLAARDPHNPFALSGLSDLSLQLYPEFLANIHARSGVAVPFQTTSTLQYGPDCTFVRLAEHSLDPRQLSAALLDAVRSTSIILEENAGPLELADTPDAIYIRDANGAEYTAPTLVHANGAWFRGQGAITPRKGQMLRVRIPESLVLTEVHRSERIYIVPRTIGPHAGTALIGATVEDAGYDLATHQPDLARLRTLAAELLPAFASEDDAPQVEAWAGTRPGTADGLPLLGPIPWSPREFVAAGHFRNGILLAPGTARVMADLLEGKTPAIDLAPFSPARFER